MSKLHSLLRKPFFGRFESKWLWPNNASRENWETVTFKNKRGARLVGLWGIAEGRSLGSLVLAHPMGKAAKGFWLRYGHADLFRQMGFNVLTFDANGFGESEAVSFDYPDDILSAGLWVRSNDSKSQIGLVGASFGAGWGICAMAREGSPFTFAVLEAAFATLPEFWRHYPAAYIALKSSQLVWPSIEKNLRPEQDAKYIKNNPNILLIYGDRDIYTPPSQGERLLAALNTCCNAELSVLPNTEHTFAFRDSTKLYIEQVKSFFLKQI